MFDITETRLYNFGPLKPHFNIVKLGFTGVHIIFLISAQKHRLWVLVRTASPRQFERVHTIYVFEQKYEKYQRFYLRILSENFQLLEVKLSIYLNRRVFVMISNICSLLLSENQFHNLRQIFNPFMLSGLF